MGGMAVIGFVDPLDLYRQIIDFLYTLIGQPQWVERYGFGAGTVIIAAIVTVLATSCVATIRSQSKDHETVDVENRPRFTRNASSIVTAALSAVPDGIPDIPSAEDDDDEGDPASDTTGSGSFESPDQILIAQESNLVIPDSNSTPLQPESDARKSKSTGIRTVSKRISDSVGTLGQSLSETGDLVGSTSDTDDAPESEDDDSAAPDDGGDDEGEKPRDATIGDEEVTLTNTQPAATGGDTGILSGITRSLIPGTDDTSDIDEEELWALATNRLINRDKAVTEENIQAEVAEIKQEAGIATDDPRDVKDTDAWKTQDQLTVAPERFDPSTSTFERDGSDGRTRTCSVYAVTSWPTEAQPGWLDKLFASGIDVDGAQVRVSLHIDPKDSSHMQSRLTRKHAEMAGDQQRADNADFSMLGKKLQSREIGQIRKKLTQGKTKMFDVAMFLEIVAKDEDTYKEADMRLRDIFREKGQARIAPVHGRMRQGMESMAPDGVLKGPYTQALPLAAVATIFPFIEPSVIEPGGVQVGYSVSTNEPVIYNRFAHSGHAILISGKIGSGKSFTSKLMKFRRYLRQPDTEMTILDPRGGFSDFVEGVNGQTITVDRDTTINPFEIKQSNVDDDMNAFQQKIGTVIGLVETIFKGELTTSSEGVLRRAIKVAYLSQGITEDPATHHHTPPTFDDLFAVLMVMMDGDSVDETIDIPSDVDEQMEFYADSDGMREKVSQQAETLLLGLEPLQDTGQYSNLNGHTSVDLTDQVAQFNLEPVSSASGDDDIVYMHLVLDWLLQRVRSSEGKQIVTIDEAHELMSHESAQKTLNAFVRQSRHWNTGLNLLSQTLDEWLNDGDEETNYSPRDIYKQCDAKILMYHADLDPGEVESLDLTKKEVEFINNATQGDKDGTDHAEALLCTDERNIRTRVYASPYEQHVLDQDKDGHAYLVGSGMVNLDGIDSKEDRAKVREILSKPDPEEVSLSDDAELHRPQNIGPHSAEAD